MWNHTKIISELEIKSSTGHKYYEGDDGPEAEIEEAHFFDDDVFFLDLRGDDEGRDEREKEDEGVNFQIYNESFVVVVVDVDVEGRGE